jgi:hypothetical protein
MLVAQRRQVDHLRTAGKAIHRERDGVARPHFGEALPDQIAGLAVDDLHSMFGGSGDRIAAAGPDAPSRRDSIDIELARALFAVVGEHANVDILPLLSVDVSQTL